MKNIKELYRDSVYKLYEYTTDELISAFPENIILYKDSGAWQVRTDDMEDVIYSQSINESFKEFLAMSMAIMTDQEWLSYSDIHTTIAFKKTFNL